MSAKLTYLNPFLMQTQRSDCPFCNREIPLEERLQVVKSKFRMPDKEIKEANPGFCVLCLRSVTAADDKKVLQCGDELHKECFDRYMASLDLAGEDVSLRNMNEPAM